MCGGAGHGLVRPGLGDKRNFMDESRGCAQRLRFEAQNAIGLPYELADLVGPWVEILFYVKGFLGGLSASFAPGKHQVRENEGR